MDVEIPEEDLFAIPQRRTQPDVRLPDGPRRDDRRRNFDIRRSPGGLMLTLAAEGEHQQRNHQERDTGPTRPSRQGVYQMGEVQARSWMMGS